MLIREDDLRGPEIAKLLGDHLDDMAKHSPPESVHALDLEALRGPENTFWTVWDDSTLLACAALKELDPTHGEIKSMRTVPAHRGKGVASFMLEHIINEGHKRAYERLSLETGSMQAFAPARALYFQYGFEICQPFADYIEDPHSVFMSRQLKIL